LLRNDRVESTVEELAGVSPAHAFDAEPLGEMGVFHCHGRRGGTGAQRSLSRSVCF